LALRVAAALLLATVFFSDTLAAMDTEQRVRLGSKAAAAFLGIGAEVKDRALSAIARRIDESRT